MHLQIRRFAFAIAALFASFGVASAQGTWSPNPQFPPAFPKPKAAEGTVQAQATTALTAAPAVAGCNNCAPAAPAAAPTHAAASAWCQDCSTTAGPRVSLASKFLSPFTIGQGCATPLGCSTFASERTFLFGSCNQFFNAGNKCGHGLCIGSTCGTGGIGDHARCAYGSNLNR